LRLSGTWLEARMPEGEYVSSYVFDFVDRKVDVMAVVRMPDAGRIAADPRLTLALTHQHRLGSYTDAQGIVQPYGAFTLVGLGLSGTQLGGRWETFVRVDNALGRTYRDFGGVPMPGRWWRVGVRIGI
jgi:hypothetical protein